MSDAVLDSDFLEDAALCLAFLGAVAGGVFLVTLLSDWLTP